MAESRIKLKQTGDRDRFVYYGQCGQEKDDRNKKAARFVMYATQASAVPAAAQVKSNQAPVLFAVPAPSSVGKGLLCLCRKVYWTNGSLMHSAYAPVTKDEAAKLLRDPNVINILSNPVSGSNLLTVAANGAIIGVQQTVGYIQNQLRSTGAQKQSVLKQSEQQGKPAVSATAVAAPNEAESVPAKAAALPQPTTTPSSAHERASAPAPATTVTSSTSMLPKINAVFTLAETGINSATLNEESAKVEASKTPSEPKTKEVTFETPKALPKEMSKRSTAESTKAPVKEFTKQSNILSDVQNKVQDNQDCQIKRDIQAAGMKRKSDVMSEASIDKKRKVTTPSGALKVKFTWNKRWTVEDEDNDSKKNSKTTKSESMNINKPPVPVECHGPKNQHQTRTCISEKQLTAVQVDTPWGSITVNNPQDFQFALDNNHKLVSINGKVPHLATQTKFGADDLKKLGCSPSCTLLQSLISTSKKKKAAKTRQQNKQLAASVQGKGPSLDTLTRHPDFNHIPTGDKVAYLKELLRMQRAALGISV